MTTLQNRILDFLTSRPDGATSAEIAEAAGAQSATCRATLSRMRDAGDVLATAPARGMIVWRVPAPGEHVHVTVPRYVTAAVEALRHGGPMTANELGAALRIRPSSTSAPLEIALRLGLVTRQKERRPRRVYVYTAVPDASSML